MSVDPVVVGAYLTAVTALLGPPIKRYLTRREVAATVDLTKTQVELTEAQAEQIRTAIYDQLVDSLHGEIARLQGRVADLEARLAQLDLALREKSAELVGVQAERDQLRIQLGAALAELQARDREVTDLKAMLALAHAGGSA